MAADILEPVSFAFWEDAPIESFVDRIEISELRRSIERFASEVQLVVLDVEPKLEVINEQKSNARPRGIFQDLDSENIEKLAAIEGKTKNKKNSKNLKGKSQRSAYTEMIANLRAENESDSESDCEIKEEEEDWDWTYFEQGENEYDDYEDDYEDEYDDSEAKSSSFMKKIYSGKNVTGDYQRNKMKNKHEKLQMRGLKHCFVNANVNKRNIEKQSRKNSNIRNNRAPTNKLWGDCRPIISQSNGWGEPEPQRRNNVQSEEERQLQMALELSLRENSNSRPVVPHAGGLTAQQIQDLTSRELTPEDYALLLLLDEGVAKKTVKKSVVESLQVIIVKQCDIHDDERCAICMDDVCDGDELKVLPCKHRFHNECITQWLTSAGHTCPIDGVSLSD